MESINRKITYRVYPNKMQTSALEELLGLHCRVYNTFLETIKLNYEADKKYNFTAMCRDLTSWKQTAPTLKTVNAQALQVTAKRVSLALNAFFKRVKKNETPGYPRFKSAKRYPGFGFKKHGDGWRFFETPNTIVNDKTVKKHNHRLRISGVGDIQIRGAGRFSGMPKTCEIMKKQDKWYASITFSVTTEAVQRETTNEVMAFDWGIKNLLTIAKLDGSIETIDNPKFLTKKLKDLKKLQQIVSLEEIKAKLLIGLTAEQPISKGVRLPITAKLKRLYKLVGNLHSKIARQRHDFYHKLSALLVKRFGCLVSEELDVIKMTKKPKAVKDQETDEFLPNGAGQKAKLNRSILDASPSKLLNFITYKAVEAGGMLNLAVTKVLKPTQRCHCCGTLVPKDLQERWHTCPVCYKHCDRDENASKTLLRWLFEPDFALWLETSLIT